MQQNGHSNGGSLRDEFLLSPFYMCAEQFALLQRFWSSNAGTPCVTGLNFAATLTVSLASVSIVFPYVIWRLSGHTIRAARPDFSGALCAFFNAFYLGGKGAFVLGSGKESVARSENPHLPF